MLSVALALAVSLFITASQALPSLEARQNCGNSYSKCSPPGATSTATPNVGDEMSSLYVDLLNSISGVKRRREAVGFLDVTRRASSGASLCCTPQTSRVPRLGQVNILNRCRGYCLSVASELQRSVLLCKFPPVNQSLCLLISFRINLPRISSYRMAHTEPS